MRRFLSAFVALAMVVGLLSGAIVPVNVVKAQATPKTLQVSKWDTPVTLSNVSGRPAVINVGGTYHMWYGPTDATLYHTSSTQPLYYEIDSFPQGR